MFTACDSLQCKKNTAKGYKLENTSTSNKSGKQMNGCGLERNAGNGCCRAPLAVPPPRKTENIEKIECKICNRLNFLE